MMKSPPPQPTGGPTLMEVFILKSCVNSNKHATCNTGPSMMKLSQTNVLSCIVHVIHFISCHCVKSRTVVLGGNISIPSTD